MEKLVPYYLQELDIIRRNLQETARQYPELAGLMSLASGECTDPAIERVIQGTALLCAHKSYQLDNAEARFTRDLLEAQEPFYLRPIPSCSIVQAASSDGRAALAIPRGTELRTRTAPVCRFHTVYDIALAPLAITVRCDTAASAPQDLGVPPGAAGAIAVTFTCTDPSIGLRELDLSSVRVFIDAEGPVQAALYDTLFMRTLCACVEADGQWRMLATPPLAPAGIPVDEALLPVYGPVSSDTRLWADYFACPAKFAFFDIDVKAVFAQCATGARSVTLHMVLPDMHHTPASRLLRALPATALRLGCSPVINLFARQAEPVRLLQGRATYPLGVPRAGEAEAVFYRLDAARLSGRAEGVDVNEEMASINRGLFRGKKYFWYAHHADETAGTPDEVSIIDQYEQPLALENGNVDMWLTCTNGDVPASIRIGHANGDLIGGQATGGSVLRLLRQPTRTRRFADYRGGHWALINATSGGYGSAGLTTQKSLVAMLQLHASPDCAVDQRQLSGIVGVERRATMQHMRSHGHGLLANGLEFRLTVDEAAFAERSIFAFACVLQTGFLYHMRMANYVQVVVLSTSGQELVRLPARMGCASPA